MGIPPTSQSVSYRGMAIVRIVEGKMVEHFGIRDTLGALRQLGATITPPPRP